MSSKEANVLDSQLPSPLQKAVDLAHEKGASIWLTALPLKDHGFALHRAAFHDAMALRYRWPPSNLPSKCDCSNNNSIDHVPKEGFPPLGTTRFAISLLIFSQKYVVRCASNHTCSRQLPTNSLELPLTHRMGRGSMSPQTECGVGDSRRPTSMYRSSPPMPPPTRTSHLLPAIESMRERKNEPMTREYVK